jgi:hypothetical protein
VDVARDLVGLHATDPKSVFLSAWSRMPDVAVEAIEHELYEARRVLRMLGMRRTMFVLPVDLAGVVHAACGTRVAARERRRLLQRLERNGVARHPDRWLVEVEESTLRAVRARGEATAAELAEDEPRLRTQILLAEGKSYEARQSVSLWVLLLLAAEGRLVRGRPRGSWISRQYRWAPMEAWLPGGLPGWMTPDARAELVRRWLASFGPGTPADLKWWSGLPAGQIAAALTAVGAVTVDLGEGTTAVVLPDDLEPGPEPEPWVALLPALDPTVMGWAERGWFLGGHRPALFDRNGNAGPTVWCDGRVVGGWAQRADGEIALRFLEDIGAEAAGMAEREAERLGRWLGETRVVPQFPTPLERELVR